MPRKSSRGKGGPRPGPKPASQNPNPVSEIPHDGGGGEAVDAAAEAVGRLDVSACPTAEDAPVELPPSSQPPLEASSSGRDELGGSLEEEAVRKLQELVGFGGEEVELTEEEAAANDQRQEDEVMRCFLSLECVIDS